MGKKNAMLVVGIVVVALLLVWKPEAGWNIRRYFSSYRAGETGTEAGLRAENAKLKAEIALLKSLERNLPRGTDNSIPAFVYARDTLNFTDEVLVGAGEENGVYVGAPVAISGVLFGKVTAVYKNKSLAMTIFDSRWRSAIRIGDGGIEALFQGGNQPTAVLIKKRADMREGDAVFNSDAQFPYGMPLGVIANMRESSDALFNEADVEVPYGAGSAEVVEILKQ